MRLPIESLKIRNLLSFGDSAEAVELRALNVLIGPNGSGKSNFIEAITLLSEMPQDMSSYIARNSGLLNWLWKGSDSPIASIETIGYSTVGSLAYNHSISFGRVEQSLQVMDESVAFRLPSDQRQRKPIFQMSAGIPVLRASSRRKEVPRESFDTRHSALWREQRPEIAFELDPLSRLYRSFRIYRGRSLNHIAPAKQPQDTDQQAIFLSPNATNLGLIINRIFRTGLRKKFIEALAEVFEGVKDLELSFESGSVQILLFEDGLQQPIPASRLSDGTFRWLCLLAILLNPDSPPLICLEEPEIGLHPYLVVALADLIREAAKRTQLIVTTHSDTLVDALTDDPESVIVCEKIHGSTSLKRLREGELRIWLKEYGLGRLWRRGQLGGNRW